MTLQTGAAVDVAYKAEAAFGVKPEPSGAAILRRIASSLALTKDMHRSSEIRPDRQVAEHRHGTRRVRGEIRAELALAGHDDLLAAALRGVWTEGVSFAAAAGAGVVASAAGRSFTRAAGSWLADGFKLGDVVRWSGLSSGNDGRNLRVVGLTDAAMTVAEAVEEVAAPVETCACAVAGRKLVTGTQAPSFAIEHHLGEAGFSQLFTGCRVGGMEIEVRPNGFAAVTYGILGRDAEVLEGAEAPHFTGASAPAEHRALAAVDATLRLAGRDVAVVTGLDLTVDLNLSADAVLGAQTVPEVFYGRTVVTGALSAFVEDASLLSAFAAGEEVALHLLFAAPGAEPRGFLAVHLPRLTFTGGEIPVQGEEGLPIRLPFQALVKADGGAGTAHDAATVVVQTCD